MKVRRKKYNEKDKFGIVCYSMPSPSISTQRYKCTLFQEGKKRQKKKKTEREKSLVAIIDIT